jgi:hypothetical protein
LDDGFSRNRETTTMMTEIENADRLTIWTNLKAVREACTAALAGSAAHPELETLAERIRLIVKSGSTDNARALFLDDSDLWPSD